MRRQGLFEEIMPLSRVSTETQKTGLWGSLKPMYEEGVGPCREACPLANDIPLFISQLKNGELEKAKETILFENPFPSICGRVCYHPCQESCNRRELDSPIAVRAIERFLGDHASYHIPLLEVRNPKKIAIVGSGPAGLSCAYFLLRLGHKVSIFEMGDSLGGLLRYGIPDYRLPKEVVEREIKMLLALNPEVQLKRKVKKDDLFSMLKVYDYVFLAPGLTEAKRIGIEGGEKEGVYYGLEFLKNRSCLEGSVKRAVIIGGGDVAMDAARTLRRLRPKAEVSIFSPETIDSLPALKENVEETKEEGIDIIGGYLPVSFEGKKRIDSVIFQATEVRKSYTGEIIFIPKNERREEKVDAVIICIGQRVNHEIFDRDLFEEKGFLKVDEKGRTNVERLYGGGDVTGQKASISDAIASGKRAAIFIDMKAKGLELPIEELRVGSKNSVSFRKYVNLEKKNLKKVIFFPYLNTLVIEREKGLEIEKENPVERIRDFREVVRTSGLEEVRKEGGRCLSCGQCKGCDLCFYLCPDVSVIKKEEGLYEVDDNYCKSCGICAKTCPSHIIEMVERDGGASIG